MRFLQFELEFAERNQTWRMDRVEVKTEKPNTERHKILVFNGNEFTYSKHTIFISTKKFNFRG